MRLVTWALRAFLFFSLFAFALNNLQDVTVHWFFGHRWQSPLVIVVLVAFACGALAGMAAMVPSWWRQRSQARRDPATAPAPAPEAALDGR